MRYLRIAYDTIWFRCHVCIGGIGGEPDIYPTWRCAWELAVLCN